MSAKELARTFFECLNRADVEGAVRLIAPDATVEIVPAGLKGTAGGTGEPFLKALIASFPDLFIQVKSAMGTEEWAALEVKMEGTQAADFLGVLNQEKHLDVDQAWMFWAKGGRVTGLRAYWCQNQLYRRLAVKRLDRVFILGDQP